jgi:hypothetical protein
MGKWLAVAAVLTPMCGPIVAHAGTNIGHAPPDRLAASRLSADQAAPTAYAVNPPASHGYIPEGWAMRATFKGRAMDLQSRDWSADPHVQPNDVEAGYGWREGRTTALIGYESHDFGPRETQTFGVSQRPTQRALERDPNLPPPVTGAGVLGFSLVLHGR